MKYLYLLLPLFLIASCKQETEQVKSESSPVEIVTSFSLPNWAKNATIYEANTRQMSAQGDFKNVQSQLPRLKNMGIDIVWLMPIHPISIAKRKATGDILVKDIADAQERSKYLGSPYAVADYKKVNPDFGTFQDFKNLVNSAHDLGMKIIIDWVPNHSGWDNPWITDHPDWYTKDKDGHMTDPINDQGEKWGWTDVADLNYENKEMRAAMIDAMQFWLREADIDGFRVDVAHGIEQSFWNETTPALQQVKPDIFLLAEAEVPSHRNDETFHASYGWNLHHKFNAIAKGENNATELDKWFEEDRAKFNKGFHMHFTSNHDENAWAGTVFDRMGNAHLTMAALAATIDGMPLLYSGMEEPLQRRLEFFKKDDIQFGKYEYAPFYKKLFDLKHRNQALWNGLYGGRLNKVMTDDNVYFFKREKNGDTVYGLFNLSKEPQTVQLPIDISGKDVMNEKATIWKKGDELKLGQWEYFLIESTK